MSVHTPKIRKKKRKEKQRQAFQIENAKRKKFTERMDRTFGKSKLHKSMSKNPKSREVMGTMASFKEILEQAVGPTSYGFAGDMFEYKENLDSETKSAFEDLVIDIKEGNL